MIITYSHQNIFIVQATGLKLAIGQHGIIMPMPCTLFLTCFMFAQWFNDPKQLHGWSFEGIRTCINMQGQTMGV